MMAKNEIKEAGLKVTLPRLQILEFLTANKGKHYTAEDLFTEMRLADQDLGLATIYRVLNQFETAGLVIKHQFEENQAVFEIDTGEHHDHMIDIDTGKVVEFYDAQLEKRQEKIADDHGYELIDHKMVLYVKKKK
uniref:ferric iron uptake transcriptional regulator n=1 Tax=Marinicella gelatinilytica TaxID=2996017 RepID=UPI002B21E882|nr:ferric iron uptake transcriptional regulator [Marinicella gelatinilytica]